MSENKIKLGLYRVLAVFILVIILIIISNIILYNSFVKEFRTQNKTFGIYHPTSSSLDELNYLNVKSISLLKSWIYSDKDTSTIAKKELLYLQKEEYPKAVKNLMWFIEQLDTKTEQNDFFEVLASMDSLFYKESIIMSKLSSFDNYSDPEIMFSIYPLISENGDIIKNSQNISNQIKKLQEDINKKIQNTNDRAKEEFLRIKLLMTWFSTFIIVIFILLSFFTTRNIIFINKLNKIIEKTSQGYLPEVERLKRKDEIGEVNRNLQHLINYLKRLSDFAKQIGENKFDTEFKPASEGDVLGNSLLQMRDNLLKAKKEAELRQIENTQRNWASQGIAVFNEVIRNYGNDLEKLTNAVIEKLVNYTDSNIGGLFIVNEDDPHHKFLELKSFYAYDRHKYIKRKVEFGETLVGQCYVENDTIYITDVPDDYIYITSGLGSDKPRSILIVPLQFNEETYGVVELASFKIFEKYQIEFVEKISETIASAISTAKINERTAKLLAESNEKSKRLEQQEIQARENIAKVQSQLEELKKKYEEAIKDIEEQIKEKAELEAKIELLQKETDEKVKREHEKLNFLISALNTTIPFYEMTVNGEISYANELYVKQLNVQEQDLINQKHINFISRDFINSGNYKKIWDQLKKGEKVTASIQYMIDGKSKFINETLIPVFDKNKKFVKVIVFGIA